MLDQIDTFSSRWDKLHFEHFQLQLQSWIVEDLIRGYAGFLWIFPPPCSRTYAIGSANSSPWFLQDFSCTLSHDPCPNLGLSMFGFGMLDGWFFRVQFRVHFFYFLFFKTVSRFLVSGSHSVIYHNLNRISWDHFWAIVQRWSWMNPVECHRWQLVPHIVCRERRIVWLCPRSSSSRTGSCWRGTSRSRGWGDRSSHTDSSRTDAVNVRKMPSWNNT